MGDRKRQAPFLRPLSSIFPPFGKEIDHVDNSLLQRYYGDLVQVRYKTRSAANGISSFNVQGGGDVLRQIAIMMSPLNPADESVQPGSWYFVIAMFKVVKGGDVNVKLTPIQNDGE